LGLQKIIYNLSLEDYYGLFESQSINGYEAEKYKEMKIDMFAWMCSLSPSEINEVFDYAAKKQTFYLLGRVQ
jgi:hypothetical protein